MTASFTLFTRLLAVACLFIAGCGGGGGGAGAQFPVASHGTPAATGDGAAPAQVPLAAPACPSCVAAGADVPPALLNSRLDCAP